MAKWRMEKEAKEELFILFIVQGYTHSLGDPRTHNGASTSLKFVTIHPQPSTFGIIGISHHVWYELLMEGFQTKIMAESPRLAHKANHP